MKCVECGRRLDLTEKQFAYKAGFEGRCLPDCPGRPNAWGNTVYGILVLILAIVLFLMMGCAVLYPEPTIDNCATHYGVARGGPLNCPLDESGKPIIAVLSYGAIQEICTGTNQVAWGCVKLEPDGIWRAYRVKYSGRWVTNSEKCHCLQGVGHTEKRTYSGTINWWKS